MHCVVSGVLFLAWENHKVFRSVVVFIPIDVGDYLSRAELAPELLLCNHSVFVPPAELGVGILLTRAFILPLTFSNQFPWGSAPKISGKCPPYADMSQPPGVFFGFAVSFHLRIRALV